MVGLGGFRRVSSFPVVKNKGQWWSFAAESSRRLEVVFGERQRLHEKLIERSCEPPGMEPSLAEQAAVHGVASGSSPASTPGDPEGVSALASSALAASALASSAAAAASAPGDPRAVGCSAASVASARTLEFLQGRQSILLHAPSLPSNVEFLLPGEYQMDTPPEVRYGLQVQYGLQVFCSLNSTVMWA